ncbi:hypothetical protein NX773_02770 [Massilia solisilvae]|uniref:Uncharacterized protein n=1 Tax=Massilia solisilvae TaxID=1811225 RepID=A0ABT2BFA3_9BURK|nr:hypothetical protein [Massilia solisilvae]MCS0607087.1 hypothetical protein [Massilia solisilvae]
MRYAALLALLLANAAWANGLDDLRSGLSTLQGQGTLRGTFEAKQSERDLDGKKPPQSAHASAQVEEDAGTLQIRWDRATLKRAADEASPPNGARRNEALSTLVGTSSALRIANLVNYAPAFVRALDGAQFKSERADTYQGKPVRLLELSLVERGPDEEQIKMKESTHIAQVWLGADNVPLAATITHKRRAKVMVFLSFEQQAREDFVFSVVANRLVVLKRDEQGTAKGFGNDTQYHNTYSFAPKA